MPRQSRSGRKRKSDLEEKLTGRKTTADTSQEPALIEGLPEPPKDFDGIAVETWNRLAPIGMQMRLFGQAEFNILCRYCRAQSEYHNLHAFIAAHGHSYTKGDSICRRPESNRYKETIAELIRMEGEMGLTPCARKSAQAYEAPELDPLEEFIS